jgi:hypothetical protein
MKLLMFRLPSAWLPLAMSSIALAVVAGHVLVVGTAREADEGAAAHLWQVLMVGQVPPAAWFAVRWLPKGPRRAIAVLAVQVAAAIAAALPVALLGL